ncbi:MAG: GTP pyrophosphokinase family protein [Clostridiales bacterium]|nr:GTP pyrophosphokinase family protein [Clostridiales bacterium]
MNLPKQYSDLKEFKKVMFLYDSALKEIETKIEILNNEFKLHNKYNPIEHVTSRIKTPQSIAKKLHHNGKEFTIENIVKYINDIAGIRIICSFKTDIFNIAEAISRQNDVKVLKIKDYVTNPKENGYSSYHMIVAVPIYLTDKVIDTKVEIQIRTIAMDYWASLEHKIYYKFEGNAPMHIREELKECANIISLLDDKMLSINDEVMNYKIQDSHETERILDVEPRMIESFGHIYEEDNESIDINYMGDSFLLEDYNVVDEVDNNKNKQEKGFAFNKTKDKETTSKKVKANNKKKNNDKIDMNLLNFFKLNTGQV